MELTLKPYHKDVYPVCGFFVEGSDLTTWLDTIDRLEVDPLQLTLYGLPTQQANVVWGCLVMTPAKLSAEQLGPLATAHLAEGRVVVPAKSLVTPELTSYDLEQLFGTDNYVLHPEIGLFHLTEPLDLRQNFAPGDVQTLDTQRPARYTVPSGEILAFSIAATPPEDLERALEEEVTREKLDNKPLNLVEKFRLKLYQSLLTSAGKFDPNGPTADKLQRLADKLGLTGADALERMMDDFEQLQERNKKEVDKLLDLMDKDPDAALRYAIPLDEHGYARGGMTGSFTMQDRGGNFSLFGSGAGGGSGGSVDLGAEYGRLQEQYRAAAKRLEAEGKHEKAAYVYHKLLKDHVAAAQTLRRGGHYEKAATIYLKYLKNELEAAKCYEEGKIYDKAIEQYAKLKRWEKIGDLNLLRGEPAAAREAYLQQLESDLARNALVKAARLSQQKLNDLPRAQKILLQGWDDNTDAYNCLQFYLNTLPDDETAWQEVHRIGTRQLNPQNDLTFIKVLRGEYQKNNDRQAEVRDLAYQLLSDLLAAGRTSAHTLSDFNESTERLRADAVRFELGNG